MIGPFDILKTLLDLKSSACTLRQIIFQGFTLNLQIWLQKAIQFLSNYKNAKWKNINTAL